MTTGERGYPLPPALREPPRHPLLEKGTFELLHRNEIVEAKPKAPHAGASAPRHTRSSQRPLPRGASLLAPSLPRARARDAHMLVVLRGLGGEKARERVAMPPRSFGKSRGGAEVLHFGGFRIHKEHSHVLRILNTSPSSLRVSIIAPSTQWFKISFDKKGLLAPGMSEDITVTFTPHEWRYYYDTVKVSRACSARLGAAQRVARGLGAVGQSTRPTASAAALSGGAMTLEAHSKLIRSLGGSARCPSPMCFGSLSDLQQPWRGR